MGIIFLGSEALARGEITRGRLRSAYKTLYPDVYMPAIRTPSLYDYTVGAWVWSHERAVITGRAAAALHGARWVDDCSPIELLAKNNHPPRGIITRNERFTSDEVVELSGMAVATIQRTAFDLGRHLKRISAISHLDALAHATGLEAEHVAPLIDAYKGARGVRRLKAALELVDGGAQSPKETWLRILLVDAGYRRPRTQIPVTDEYGRQFAFLDMGWEDEKIAVEYDGDQHRKDRAQYAWDIKRLTMIQDRGWIHTRVIAEDRPSEIIARVRRAWAQRKGSQGR